MQIGGLGGGNTTLAVKKKMEVNDMCSRGAAC